MGKSYTQTSDISGVEIKDGEEAYQVSFSKTVERGKSFAKADGFILTHAEFMEMIGKQNFKPDWQQIVKNDATGKWEKQ